MDKAVQDARAVQAEVDKLLADRAGRGPALTGSDLADKANQRAEHLASFKGKMNPDLSVMRQPKKITIKIGRNFVKRAVQGLGMVSVARSLQAASPILPTRHAAPGTVRPGYKRRSPKPAATHRMAWCRPLAIPNNGEYDRREIETLLRRIDGCYRAINRHGQHDGAGQAKKTLARLKAWFKGRFPHERHQLTAVTQRWLSRAN